MRLALIATVSALLATAALCDSSHYAEYISKFSAFKKEYNRTYATPEEEAKRLHIFIENLKDAAVLQKRNPLAKFGVNAYTDLSKEEFKGRHNAEAYFRAGVRRRRSREVKEDPKVLAKARSNSVDWRNQGVVTPIKNQGQCGGCWAFSTTGNIEGQWAIAGNPLTSLSEQELISCVNTCNGCNGGLMDNAFNWLIDANGGGITSESQYPFESASGSVPACQSGSVSSVATITSLVDVAHSESYMASWVAQNGPLSIGVDATSWQTFGGGIMTDCVSNQVDHAVLIVGYNFDASPAYWIIKNQWGTSWGNDGYMYLEYGSNECLLTTIPSSSQV